jgi:putative MATE family efflux protein
MRIQKHAVDMCNGPLFMNIVRFTVPIVLMNALQLLYNAADTIIVGRFDGQAAVAAVGATTPMINLIVNVFIGLSVGVNVCIGTYCGARRDEDVRRATGSAMMLGVGSGLIVTVLGIAFSRVILTLMQTPTDVLDASVLYANVYFLGAPANLLYNFLAAVLRAKGDTKRPLFILAFCGAINVILNVVFVALFNMGVLGVAIATVISQYISAVLIVFMILRDDGGRLFSEFKIHRESLKEITVLGVPSGIQGSVFSLSSMVIQAAINSFGAAAIAGNSAASNIDTFSYIAFNSFQTTSVAFIAQNCGAKNIKRIDKVFKYCILSAIAVAVISGWLIYFLSPILMDLYLPGDTEAIAFGAVRIRYICLPYFLLAMMDVTVGALRGFGSSLIPTLISIVGSCGLRILWIYTAFKYYSSVDILYISFPLAWLITFFALFIAYRAVRRRKAQEFSIGTY